MIKNKLYRHKETGKVSVQIPLMQIADYQEVEYVSHAQVSRRYIEKMLAEFPDEDIFEVRIYTIKDGIEVRVVELKEGDLPF